jgi:hypothetical protein
MEDEVRQRMPDENRTAKVIVLASEDPRSGSSLVPMLVGGLAMIVLGMIAVAVFS